MRKIRENTDSTPVISKGGRGGGGDTLMRSTHEALTKLIAFQRSNALAFENW